ncbi:MAG: Wzz/FepE/Etk N-terminal domain-containing protein [Thermoleophilia bacterium]
MDLAEMLSVLWKSKWMMLVAAALVAVLIGYNSFSREEVYRAETAMIVSSLTPTNVFSNEDMLAASYGELVLTEAVQSKASEISSATGGPSSVSSTIAAETKADSPFIRVIVTNTNPERAVSDANAVSTALVEYVSELQQSSLDEKQESLLRELADIDTQRDEVKAAIPVDETRLAALDLVRQSIIRQYEELNAGTLLSSVVVVDQAGKASMEATHPLRNTIVGFFLGGLAGAIIGFSVESVRKAL